MIVFRFVKIFILGGVN